MSSKIISILILSVLFIFWGCGKSGDDRPDENQKTESEEIMI